jgi:uncharacterized repeat protein (TIGR01451 family)
MRLPAALLALLALLLTGLFGAGPAAASPPAAGIAITNTASGAYVDSTSGLHVRLTSNTVATDVQPFEALLLTSSQSLSGAPGAAFTFAHQLTNTGNVLTNYALALTESGSVTPVGLQIIEDSNGNGVADPGEPVLASGSSVPLAPGAMLNLLVVGTVPAGTSPGQTAQLRLGARSLIQGASTANVDTLTIVGGAAVMLTKAASTPAPLPRGVITYTLTAQNTGSGAAGPVAVTVNGSAVSLFMVRDLVPANTTFANGAALTPGAQALFHRLGDPASTYVSTPPVGIAVDQVAWGMAALAPTATLVGTLGVTVNANATGTLGNTGYADFTNLGAPVTVPSNPVTLPLPTLAPTILFYTTNTYAKVTDQSMPGAQLYLQVNAAACNTNPSIIITEPITLVSQLTGDTETFTATETTPNSGIFRILPSVPTANAAIHVVAAGDGILEVLPNDRVTASLAGCGAATTSANLLIDPSGTVFNSKTNAPIAGATVELIDVTGAGNGGHPGAPATVFAADGTTRAPSTVVTQVGGTYSFPFVPASTYRFVVTAPNGFKFPSKLPPGLLPIGRNVNAPASYGGNFVLSLGGAPLTLDIPLDSGAAGGLFLAKVASKPAAAVGDFVDYVLTLNNDTGIAMPAISVRDVLPLGFAYVPGSARLNGVALADPAGGVGPTLQFSAGNLAPTAAAVITYRVRLGPASQSGTGVNTAQAFSGPTQSNVASATVKVGGSVFSDKAYLFGKVFADCNGDRLQDADEPGVPGVRIYLDDGTFAVTDIEGKYSLYGLNPRTHVAKIDVTTLPLGSRLEILNNRNALDGGSQFVDLRSGELHQTNFALVGCAAALRSDIEARRHALQGQRTELAALVTTPLQANPAAVADPRTLAASGVIGQRPGVAAADTSGATKQSSTSSPAGTSSQASTAGAAGATVADPAEPASAMPEDTLAHELRSMSPELAFLNVIDGGVVPNAQIRVRVKGAFGSQLLLAVNGENVSLAQVGERSSLENRGITAWEYIGVNLEPGDNLLQVRMVDAFGNVRDTRSLHLTAPGPLAHIVVTAAAQGEADVQTPLEVTVELQDAHDVPVHARTAVTLFATLGEWQTKDLDPKEPGTQVFIEDGSAHFKLMPPAVPGKATLRAVSGTVHGERDVTFMPHLRPLLVAGLAEGVVSLHSLNPGTLLAAQSGDPFEREIASAAASFDDGKGDAAARASLFLKGKILGSNLLTLAYDSDKPNDTPLFRDIQPDQYYPVYGDSSVKGYDAQSTGKLYVRIDHGTSAVLYGDFSTQSDNPARVLTQYTRALNGAKTHIEDGNVTLDGFASYTNTTQVIDELPANGTSGPYQMSQRNPVANSQRVDIITRDRNQPSLVIADQPLTQFTDYAVEAFSAQILLKAPVPSVDANLNPIYIRVVYEVSDGGPSYWVGGLDARDQVRSGLTLGGTYIRDSNPVSRETLGGANFLWTPNHDTSLVGEVAVSQSDLNGTGGAHRIELKHTDAHVQARIYAVQTDSSFDNPSSTYTAGTAQYGAKISAAFDAKNRLLIEALKTTTSGATLQSPLTIPITGVAESVSGGGSQQGESVALEHTLRRKLKLTAGVRHADANGTATQTLAVGAVPLDYTSARVRLDAPVPGLPRANAYVQYEEAIDDARLKDATVGATYQMDAQTKLYATHQTSNSLSGDYGLNSSQQNDLTVVGIDTSYMHDGKMFDEYRVGDGIDGRSAEAAIGLRNLWTLAPGLGVTTSLQQIHPISGVVTDTATALTAGIQYTANPDWKASSRVEWSKSETAETWLSNVAAAAKLSPDLTALVRGVYNEQLSSSTGTGSVYLRQEQLGFAYRPVNNDVWNALAWVEHKRSINETLGLGLNLDESADIVSAHVNYQVDAGWLINGRYGIKRAVDYASGLQTAYTAQLLGARSIWDVSERWDVGVQYFIETGAIGKDRQQAIGAEVGYLVMQNVWLSAGYNVSGFKDVDLASEDYTQKAFYIRIRVKFDENLFKPKHNDQALPADAAVMK